MATSSTSDALAGATEATEFGAAILNMRVAHNTDLATVASTLRIRQVYLQAIEDGRFSDLPGPTYAAGFVRAYAEFLGLDISEVMRRYREVALGSDRQAPLVAPSPVVEGTMPTGFILLVGAVLAAVAYGSWYYLTLNGRDTGNIVAELPKQIADIVGMETTAPADTMAEPATPVVQSEPEPEPEPVIEATQSASDQLLPATVDDTITLIEPQIIQETPEVIQAEQSEAPQEPQPVAAVVPPPAKKKPPQKKLAIVRSPVPEPEEVREPPSSVAPAVTVTVAPEPTPAPEPVRDPVRDIASVVPETPVSLGAANAAVSDQAAAVAQEAPEIPVQTLTAGEGPLASLDTIETSTVSTEGAKSLAATGLPGASQSAALPDSPGDASGSDVAGRVVLRATAISWVELRDANGKRVFSRLLKKGETYNVPGRSGITLATGNAGALDVVVDGETIGPLGPAGAVRRNVLLEPAALLRRGNIRR